VTADGDNIYTSKAAVKRNLFVSPAAAGDSVLLPGD
jgi:hypothetical protein